MLELYLGGARSGKSRLAEQRARDSGKALLYIATATAGDDEMAARIAHHQQQRGNEWQTLEESYHLGAALQREAGPERCVLIDCLTLWLSNWLIKDNPEAWQLAKAEFFQALKGLSGNVILVSNEVGQGIVPDNRLARQFIDEAGWLHQGIAELCDRVVFVTAGLPQIIKGD